MEDKHPSAIDWNKVKEAKRIIRDAKKSKINKIFINMKMRPYKNTLFTHLHQYEEPLPPCESSIVDIPIYANKFIFNTNKNENN